MPGPQLGISRAMRWSHLHCPGAHMWLNSRVCDEREKLPSQGVTKLSPVQMCVSGVARMNSHSHVSRQCLWPCGSYHNLCIRLSIHREGHRNKEAERHRSGAARQSKLCAARQGPALHLNIRDG